MGSLAFPRHRETTIGLRLNFERLRQMAGAVVSTNRITDLDDLLWREKPTELGREPQTWRLCLLRPKLDIAVCTIGPTRITRARKLWPAILYHFNRFSSALTSSVLDFSDNGSRNSSSDLPFSIWRSGRTENRQRKTTTMNAMSTTIANDVCTSASCPEFSRTLFE